ncbi:MAG TPA: hypothetical protein VFF50_01090, partial [Candidatus Deferrimicrobiaceae bacterium]|nr:hypothetical protein [Candidatus Deferrimicrobiaceae bacterium]
LDERESRGLSEASACKAEAATGRLRSLGDRVNSTSGENTAGRDQFSPVPPAQRSAKGVANSHNSHPRDERETKEEQTLSRHDVERVVTMQNEPQAGKSAKCGGIHGIASCCLFVLSR